ncbi:hypothetical protein, conserved [Eimeria brunetti]|uniref:tRNA-uridine aminocarboxypropyltransferase n=1 Tax=Eimeria brunetti TaxID=51314 RepID=U6LFB6_9EIME|nr:hypothetical protein, conserved [Eimeria brunetti]
MAHASAASQHAVDPPNRPISSATCVAKESPKADAETEGGELFRQCCTSAVFTGDSVQQQEQRLGQQQQQKGMEQHHQREEPESEQTGRRQEGEAEEQQQQHAPKRRRVCAGCNRPCSVCYCSIIQGRDLSLAEHGVSSIVNRVLIFMHPLEQKRKNNSVRVLQRLVKGVEIWPHRRPGCCPFAAEMQYKQGGEEEHDEKHRTVVMEDSEGPPCASESAVGIEGLDEACAADCRVEDAAADGSRQQHQQDQQEKQPQPKQQQKHLCSRDGVAVCDTSRMILLFPTESSLALGTGSLPVRLPVTLLAIDGTWKEAKEMFTASPWLQQLPAVHLPIQQNVDPLHNASVRSAAAGTNTADAYASCCSRSMDATEALRVSGAYGMIRTPPANVAASGGVCTAEAIAQALSMLGRWGRSGSSSLLQIGETTRKTLQHIVSLQQRMRGENSKRKVVA